MNETRRRYPQSVRPSGDEGLSRDELRRLGRAERKLAGGDPSQAAAGRREVEALERRHSERLEAFRLAARLDETQRLARLRGEEVRAERVRVSTPLTDEHGARVVRQGLPLYRQETVSRVRILSRGGLQLAFERGDLDGARLHAERLLEAGKVYRWAFEASSAMGTPERDLSSASARAPLRASAGPQDSVFAAGEALRIMRADLDRRQRQALDAVCGLDMTVRAAALAVRADPRSVRKALAEGLCVAAEARRPASPAQQTLA